MFRKSIVVVAVLAVALVLLQVPSSYGRYGPGGGRGRVIIRVVFDHPWDENLVNSPYLSALGGNSFEMTRIRIASFPWDFGFTHIFSTATKTGMSLDIEGSGNNGSAAIDMSLNLTNVVCSMGVTP